MPSYPALTGNVSVHRPWGYDREYKNVHNDRPHGYRYSFNLRATPLMLFVIDYDTLADVDATALLNFFVARGGAYEDFEFTNPETTTVHTKCRFDQDALNLRRVGPNQNAVQVRIQEYP